MSSQAESGVQEVGDPSFGLAPSAPSTTVVPPTAGLPVTGPAGAQQAAIPKSSGDGVAGPVAPVSAQPLVENRDGLARGLPDQPVRTRLAELADAASTVIRLAARDGKTSARITLRPAELGEVEIRLRYHAGGLSADVVAESPQAAQTLQQSIGDLRRSLESHGVVVHWLDVRTGDEGRRSWQEAWHPGRGRAAGRIEAADELDESSTSLSPTGLPAPAGTVDVLA